MVAGYHETVLDDEAALEVGDPGGMLPAVASSAAQVRAAALAAAEAGIARLRDGGRPRTVVVIGMGGSGIAGDLLAALAGPSCPVPVLVHKGYGLPSWVGAADVVIAVSCSGLTEETLTGLDEAARRGCPVIAVGAADSPLHVRTAVAHGYFVPVPGGRQPRASLWSLVIPTVLVGDALGLLSAPAADVEATAVRLEDIATRCRPGSEVFVNPAKSLAVSLAGSLPVLWGTSPLTGAAASRFACQLNENAKQPAVHGALPEVNHNQVVAFDGPFGALASRFVRAGDHGADLAQDEDPLFRDRTEDAPIRQHLVLLRDREDEHPQVVRRAEISAELARDRGLGVTELVAEGSSRLERLAMLVGLTDYASVYLALLAGIDPTPVDAITALQRRVLG